MKLTAWDAALSSVRQVLKIQPNNEKALFRKAKILQEKLQIDEAIGILRRISRSALFIFATSFYLFL